MATFHFDLVLARKTRLLRRSRSVDVPGMEGDFGVFAGHAPVVAAVRPGHPDHHPSGGGHQKIIVLGGSPKVSRKGPHRAGPNVATSTQNRPRRVPPRRSRKWEAKLAEKEGSNSTTPSSGSITSRAFQHQLSTTAMH